jgi:creatinine amidohydrolase
MRFDELNWFDIESFLLHDQRLMIILGSCEQHAYLSMLSDVRIPLALGDAASQQTGVLVAPPLNFGSSPYFLDYPGTLSLKITTLIHIVEDLVHSAYHQGFRKFLLLNGHGGNDPARSSLYELANELPDVKFAWYSWWQSHSVSLIAQKHGLKPTHASWLEAFPFTRVIDIPDEPKIPPRVPGIISSKQARIIYGDGNFGGPYYVQNEIMDEIFAAALADILQLLKFEE